MAVRHRIRILVETQPMILSRSTGARVRVAEVCCAVDSVPITYTGSCDTPSAGYIARPNSDTIYSRYDSPRCHDYYVVTTY